MTTTLQADINTNANAFISNSAAVAGAGSVGGVGGSGNASNAGADNNNGGNRTPSNNLNIGHSNQSNNIPNINIGANIQRGGDTGKRKKLKSRNAGAPHMGYSKDHLDAWLETCLKDASNTQLSSSSEFLDYNPPTGSNKNMFSPQQQQQQPQQMPLQQQQQSPLQQAYPLGNQQHLPQPQQQQQLQQQLQQQQQFAMRTNSQQPMASQPSAYNAPFSQGLQHSGVPNFMRHSNAHNNRYSMMFPAVGGGGFYQQNDGSQDFTSLPPIVNMMGGGSSELEQNSTDVLDGSGSNPNIARGFRFSDPCLLNPSDNDSKMSGQNTPDRRNNVPSEMDNNKFYAALMEQINLLHETNSKICRNLHETKVDIEALKHAPTWGMRHRRDSLSGLSTHSQPMVFGGGFGTHSPAPTYHSGAYTPGMMTDVVREVKEAARVREDALLNRVKAMVEERQWSMNETNLRMMRDIEDLKSQIHHLRTDRKEASKRLTHLEAENKYMRQMLATIINSRQTPDIIYENEALRTRKTFPHSRRTQSLNLHYGTIHHQPSAAAASLLEEYDEQPLHISEQAPASPNTADVAALSAQRATSEMRSSFSSSDGGGGVPANTNTKTAPSSSAVPNGGSGNAQIMSPPNFALVSSPLEGELNRKKDRLEKQEKIGEEPASDQPKATAQALQQELSEAVAARNQADGRIIALENLVKNLQVHASTTHIADASTPIVNGVGLDHSVGGGFTNNAPSAAKVRQIPPGVVWYQQPPLAASIAYNSGPGSNRQHQAHTNATTTTVCMAQAPPKLSVAGPITDL